MKTRFATRTLVCLCAGALLLLTACDRLGIVTPEARDRVTFSFETTEAASPHATGRFTAAGAFLDEGYFEAYRVMGGPKEAPTTLYGWRKLTGRSGAVRLMYTGYIDQGSVRGFSEVDHGTGAYQRLVGCRESFEWQYATEHLPERSSHRLPALRSEP